ncbi:MAG TPA: Hsp20/alpha crystallin family protein [Allosphingosinicella sp.]|nr:Hsp20/alpha crystallin family protein [Allosphingosinicella sp.]
MSMRDLIPWGRQDNSGAPVPYNRDESSPFLSLRRDVDRLFDDFFRGTVPSTSFLRSSMGWPSVEVSDSDREVRVTAEVPGMSEKDVELLMENGVLTLRGEKKSENKDKDKDRGYSERFYGRFERRIALPDGVEEEGADASFRDGVLTVTLPKSVQAQRGRRIPINGETKH